MVDRPGKVIVLSSVSGGGKTTLINLFREKYPLVEGAVTATTRNPRPGEIDGIHYHFYSKETFQGLIQEDELLEYAEVHGNYYGVPAGPVREKLRDGKNVILNIDIQGMRSVKRALGPDEVVSIFLMPPSIEEWEKRLRNRKSDTEGDIQKRLENGKEELKAADEFDVVIVNDSLDRAFREMEEALRLRGLIFE